MHTLNLLIPYISQAVLVPNACGPDSGGTEWIAECSGEPTGPTIAPTALSTIPPACETNVNTAGACLGNLASSCINCVGDTFDHLFDISDSVLCDTVDSKVCTAIYDSCDCGSCTNEVEAMYDCLILDTDCLGLDCEDPAEPPVLPTNAPTLPPTDPPTLPPVEPIRGEEEPTPKPRPDIPIDKDDGPDHSGTSTVSCYTMFIAGLLAATTFLW